MKNHFLAKLVKEPSNFSVSWKTNKNLPPKKKRTFKAIAKLTYSSTLSEDHPTFPDQSVFKKELIVAMN